MKYIKYMLLLLFFSTIGYSQADQTETRTRNLVPRLADTYDIGRSNRPYDSLFVNSIAAGVIAGTISADSVVVDTVDAPTYTTVQDWLNTTQSGGIISGFEITDSGSGQIDIAAGKGIIKTTDSGIGVDKFFDYAGTINVDLVDNDVTYIYIDYNSGTPVADTTITQSNINHNDKIGIGRVYREGTVVHILSGGVQIDNIPYKVHQRFVNQFGFTKTSGLVTTEDGDLNLDITSGVIWNGLTRVPLSAVNTLASANYTYHYKDHTGWVSDTISVIDNTYYNDYEANPGLVALTTNQYGTHFVYIHYKGDVHVVYGLASYNLSEAQEVGTPANLPDIVKDFSTFIAKIIIKKSLASSFTEVIIPVNTADISTPATDHGALGGLGDDDHTIYILHDGTRAFSGNQAFGGFNLTNIGSMGETGTRITKGWFTDVESSNDITIGGTALAATYQPLDAILTSLVAAFSTGSGQTTDIGTLVTLETFGITATTIVTITSTVSGMRVNAEDGGGYIIVGTFKNSAGTVTQIGATTAVHLVEDDADGTCVYTISGTDVLLQVTGFGIVTVNWDSMSSIVTGT